MHVLSACFRQIKRLMNFKVDTTDGVTIIEVPGDSLDVGNSAEFKHSASQAAQLLAENVLRQRMLHRLFKRFGRLQRAARPVLRIAHDAERLADARGNLQFQFNSP